MEIKYFSCSTIRYTLKIAVHIAHGSMICRLDIFNMGYGVDHVQTKQSILASNRGEMNLGKLGFLRIQICHY